MAHVFKVYRILPDLFHIQFGSKFLMNMHFWRAFTPFNQTFIDFMEEYVANSGKNYFTFTADYHGFFFDKEVYDSKYTKIIDRNKYDDNVKAIDEKLCIEHPKYNCIVSCSKSGLSLFKHEIAHYLFDCNDAYKCDTLKALESMDGNVLGALQSHMAELGYVGTETFILSEIQAHLATGFDIKPSIKNINKYIRVFRSIFKQHFQLLKFQKEYLFAG